MSAYAKYSVSCVILIGLVWWGGISTVVAQGGDTPSAPGGTTIHVVQRDENLFRIAMQYGTTVEAIAEANGITDARYISVGQRLLIPNAQIDAPGALIRYVVQPGDTLETISRAYSTTVESLASANHLTHPDRLYIGQELVINHGGADPALRPPQRLHRAKSGDNVYRIALAYNVPLSDLLLANELALPAPLFPGQPLWIPGGDGTSTLSDFPPPFTSCDLKPIPAVQGGTIGLHATTSEPVTLSGTFMDRALLFATQDTTQHDALFGIHAFTVAGVYPVTLTATAGDGTQSMLTLYVKVDDGGYGSETISLATEQQDLLKPEVNEPEWQRIATPMSGFSDRRYFEGMMGLPASGAITSQFGTRRDYNGGQLNTFHSGTDFGGASGVPIVAPAAGVVVLAENMPVRGNATIIDHGWGVYTGYWHQSEIYVIVGDVVDAGQTIGTIGSTGRVTGPHLHWEMWVGGVQVDPMQWVQQSFP